MECGRQGKPSARGVAPIENPRRAQGLMMRSVKSLFGLLLTRVAERNSIGSIKNNGKGGLYV